MGDLLSFSPRGSQYPVRHYDHITRCDAVPYPVLPNCISPHADFPLIHSLKNCFLPHANQFEERSLKYRGQGGRNIISDEAMNEIMYIISHLVYIEILNIGAFFINSVSPVKTSRKCKYFDMKLVTKDSARRAVCFAVNRKNEFQEIQNNKSPVKINDYTISNRFGSDDMLIDERSKIEVLKNALFEPVHIDIAEIVKIAELDNILTDEIVTVKGKLVSISGVKKVLFEKKLAIKKKA